MPADIVATLATLVWMECARLEHCLPPFVTFRVGGLRFVKCGRLCVSFCLTRR